jgi:hypothetical protein
VRRPCCSNRISDTTGLFAASGVCWQLASVTITLNVLSLWNQKRGLRPRMAVPCMDGPRRTRARGYCNIKRSRVGFYLSWQILPHNLPFSPGSQAMFFLGLEKLFPNFHQECKRSMIKCVSCLSLSRNVKTYLISSILGADFKISARSLS